jgi:hypothetical protein
VFSDSALTNLHSTDSLATDTVSVCRSLQNHKAYWWRVSAHNAAGWGLPCQASKFVVKVPSTAVIPLKVSMKIGSVSGANGNIRFGLPVTTRVMIKIFDVRGKLAGTIMDGEQKAGFHSVFIKNAGLANGNYLLTFRAGQYSKTGMISIFNH